MDRDDQIAELFGRWKASRSRGTPLTPEELCGDCPELLDDFRAALPDLAAIEAVFDEQAAAAGEALSDDLETPGYQSLSYHREGGLGVVLVGEDVELRRTVALKRMKPRVAHDETARQRFVQEAETTARLDHPGIIPIYRMGADGAGHPYYAMRFIQGDTLQECIDRFHAAAPAAASAERNLEFRRLVRSLVTVCQTVAFAHARGVIHRDLKPANIMLGPFGETLVVDWGLAKQLDQSEADPSSVATVLEASVSPSASLEGRAKGSPAFMSPEQARGEWSQVSRASDIYSLGSTLYVLLTGRLPYAAANTWETLVRVRTGEFAPPRAVSPGVPPELDAVCRKAMAARPDERYADARALADDLERWLADEPVSVWREPLLARARRWIRRHRTLATALLAAICVAGLSAGALAFQEHRANRRLAAAHDDLQHAYDDVERNFASARSAVRDLASHAMNDPLLRRPGTFAARQSMLRTAQRHYQNLIAAGQDQDPALPIELALAHYAVGISTFETGSPEDALRELRQAQGVLKRLVQENPDLPQIGSFLADVTLQRGIAECRTGAWDAGLAEIDEALRLGERSTAEREPLDQVARLISLLAAAELYADAGRTPQADEAVAAARAIGRTQLEAGRDAPQPLPIVRATALNELAAWELRLGQPRRAEPLLEQAAALLATAEQDPGDGDAAFVAALVEQQQAELALQSGETERAVAATRSARMAFESLAQQNPELVTFAPFIARTWFLEGWARQEAEEWEPAVEPLDEAYRRYQQLRTARPLDRELQDRSAQAAQMLAIVRGQLGQSEPARALLDEARQVLETLRADVPKQPRYVFQLATIENTEGMRQLKAGALDPAEASFEQARGLLDRALAQQPQNEQFRHALATVYQNLGAVRMLREDASGAVDWFTRSRSLVDPLLAENAGIARYQRTAQKLDQGLGTSYAALALERWESGQADEAFALFQRADELLEPLGRDEAGPAGARDAYLLHLRGWSETLHQEALRAWEQDDLRRALRLFEQALPVWEKLAAAQPGDADVDESLNQVRLGLALVVQAVVKTLDASQPANASESRRLLRLALSALDALHGRFRQAAETDGIPADLRTRLDALPAEVP